VGGRISSVVACLTAWHPASSSDTMGPIRIGWYLPRDKCVLDAAGRDSLSLLEGLLNENISLKLACFTLCIR
jgi:hypothetical protein